MNDDAQLLRLFAEKTDQAAFGELVKRHLPLVHSAALRQVGGDAHLAADIAQSVFTDMARKAATLASHPVLVGWLHTSTHHAAAKAVRAERRRRAREQIAFAMNETVAATEPAVEVDWTRLGPVLDAELQRLKETERSVLLLRHFKHLSYAEIGQQTGLSENAARMKADRALEKLRSLLTKRGISSTAAALGASLTSQAVVMPPAGLAATITQQALVQAAALGALGGTAGFLSLMKIIATPLALGGALVSAFVFSYGSQQAEAAALRNEIAAASTATSTQPATSVQPATNAATPVATSTSGESISAEKPAETENAVYPLKGLSKQPVPKLRTKPVYPFEMRATGIRGEVTVEFVVDKKGFVTGAKSVKATNEAFAKAAVEAVSKWKFTPGEKDGRTVKTRLQVPIIFDIASKGKNWF